METNVGFSDRDYSTRQNSTFSAFQGAQHRVYLTMFDSNRAIHGIFENIWNEEFENARKSSRPVRHLVQFQERAAKALRSNNHERTLVPIKTGGAASLAGDPYARSPEKVIPANSALVRLSSLQREPGIG
jgi:hypothetical protein